MRVGGAACRDGCHSYSAAQETIQVPWRNFWHAKRYPARTERCLVDHNQTALTEETT